MPDPIARTITTRRLTAAPSAVLSAGALLALFVVALFGERLAPHESIYFVPVHGDNPRPYEPGLVFPFGSDVLGRDLFSLVLAGAGTTLTIVLLAGLSRVVAGAFMAAVARSWHPARPLIEWVAELVSAVPATLVALLLVKVLVKSGDVSIPLFISALLLTGWAGPYRVIRAELARLALMPFTQGALAIGVGESRLLIRHHLPHLVPVLAVNFSQQAVAALVLVAELGVLGVFVGTTRLINIGESLGGLAGLRSGAVSAARISEVPEWGGLLAGARTIESLWTTRWLILLPGVAFGVTAVAIAVIGFALARRYARRDIMDDLRSKWLAAFGLTLVALFMVSALIPERYAGARDWATFARAEVRHTVDIQSSFAEAGVRPVGASYAVARDLTNIAQTGGATVTVGGVSVKEVWPRPINPPAGSPLRSFVTAFTGGGAFEGPLVFAARGINPSDYPPSAAPLRYPGAQGPDLGTLIKDYASDYAGIDVRSKVVLLVRFMGISAPVPNAARRGYSVGPSVEDAIARAIKRGAAAVIFVDPALPYYSDTNVGVSYRCCGQIDGIAGVSPYVQTERIFPATGTSGVPVAVVSAETAKDLVAPIGLDLTPFLSWDKYGSDEYKRSTARDLGVSARVEVPLRRESGSITSVVGEVGGVPPDAVRVVIWSVRRPGQSHQAVDVLAALAREFGSRRVPFVFVDFDPAVDPNANAKSIREALGDRRIGLLVVLDNLDGSVLRFTTPYGDLIPAFDLYAAKAGARYEPTRSTPALAAIDHVAPFIDVKTVLVTGDGGAGDLRADAAGLLGYLAGRLALGAVELPR